MEKTLEELKAEYLKSLTEQEYKAYLIALDHLKGIFYLEETNGFLDWIRGTKVPLRGFVPSSLTRSTPPPKVAPNP